MVIVRASIMLLLTVSLKRNARNQAPFREVFQKRLRVEFADGF
jgi:hypothetical protein